MKRRSQAVVAGVALLLAALLATFGSLLVTSHTRARHEVEQRFRERAQISAALTHSFLASSAASAARLNARHYGTDPVPPHVLAREVRRGHLAYLVVLSADGHVLASSPGAPAAAVRSIAGRPAHVRAALAGRVYGLSNLRSVGPTTKAFEFAQPFPTANGRRILVTGFGPRLLYDFISGYLAQVPNARGRVYVLDGHEAVVGDPRRRLLPGERLDDPRLAAKLATSGQGSVGDGRYFTSAAVEGSPWRVVLVASSAELFSTIEGPGRLIPWLLFAAFAMAAAAALALMSRVLRRTAQLADANGQLEDRVAELGESRERFALAAKGANDGIWDRDLVAGHVYFSPRVLEIIGEQTLGDEPAAAWDQRIHPDDRARWRAAFLAHAEGATPRFELEYRVRHRDGTYRWLRTRGVAIRDATGQATRVAGSISDITDRKAAERQLVHDAMHDRLTGLPNRALLLDRLAQAVARGQRDPAHACGVLFLDLDRFKLVNDSFSHAVGDELLVALARRLSALLRPEDTLARLGGDEFTILLADVGAGEAAEVAERVHRALEAPFRITGHDLTVHASIGISLSESGSDAHELLRNADIAMYDAKRNGKARWAMFDQSMHTRVAGRLSIENELRAAISERRLRVHYQPIVDLGTGRISGFEALARWPEGELPVRPDEFIPVAEDAGMISALGRVVLDEACATLADWRERGIVGPESRMSVNVSGRQLADPALIVDVADALRRSGLKADCLQLEITESTIIDEPEQMQGVLTELAQLGVHVHIDDFGTGYSSLTFLHQFPGDTLKVDRSFVAAMCESEDSEEIVRAIVGLAHNLGLRTIAEGVETAEQAQALRALGCEYAQGYLFARPLGAAAIEELLGAWDAGAVARVGDAAPVRRSAGRGRR